MPLFHIQLNGSKCYKASTCHFLRLPEAMVPIHICSAFEFGAPKSDRMTRLCGKIEELEVEVTQNFGSRMVAHSDACPNPDWENLGNEV